MSGGNWKEMFEAAVSGDLELVDYHVRAGVDVNYAHPEFLSTPLVAAILARQVEVARLLLRAGADPDLGSEFDAANPIQAARRVGLLHLEQELLSLGARPVPLEPVRTTWLSRLFARLGF